MRATKSHVKEIKNVIRYTEFVYRGDGVHFLSGFARRHIGPSKRVRSVNSG